MIGASVAGIESVLAVVREHRSNVVTEGVWDPDPERSTQRTCVKCDGNDCQFYVERASWFDARDAHDAHVAAVLADREAALLAAERERIAQAIEQAALPTSQRPAPGRHVARGETLAHNVGIKKAAAIARAANPEQRSGE